MRRRGLYQLIEYEGDMQIITYTDKPKITMKLPWRLTNLNTGKVKERTGQTFTRLHDVYQRLKGEQ
jgi:hypothetical protein